MRRILWLLVGGALSIGLVSLGLVRWQSSVDSEPDPYVLPVQPDKVLELQSTENDSPSDTLTETEIETENQNQQGDFTVDGPALQDAVDTWSLKQGGSASITVMLPDGSIVASADPDRVYNGASIYKLYVAYFGYIQVDTGVVDPDEQYINGHTRLECLDLMIRESDSPCAEKMWVEIGQTYMNQQLTLLGIQNTDMENINTSSIDTAKIFAQVIRGDGLSVESQTAYLESARTQVFRDALNSGFSDRVTTYNKVGFREQNEYHDVAVVESTAGDRIIVSVFTDGAYTSSDIASLARTIESILLSE